MYTDRKEMQEYAYNGVFYKTDVAIPDDGDLLGDNEAKEVTILETKCDIQETNKLFNSGVITMGYTIYFPMPTKLDENGDEVETIPDGLKPGIRFRGSLYDLAVEGMVIGVYPTQMHGCVAYIKGTDI